MTKIDKEIWKQIPDFRGYEVSNFGNVRSWNDRYRYSGKERPLAKEPHPLKPHAVFRGRLAVALIRNRKHHSITIHRLVLLAFVGPCPKGMESCHYDGDPTNNYLSNLRWDTRQANWIDRRRHGNHGMGSQHGRARLTEYQVKRIRQFFECGFNYYELAETFKIGRTTIGHIINGRTWKHVGGPIIHSGQRRNRKHFHHLSAIAYCP